jgi:hypothetical protein
MVFPERRPLARPTADNLSFHAGSKTGAPGLRFCIVAQASRLQKPTNLPAKELVRSSQPRPMVLMLVSLFPGNHPVLAVDTVLVLASRHPGR